MKIREHVYALGRCVFCGALDLAALAELWHQMGRMGDPEPDKRSCIERDDGMAASGLRPEPKRREIACEDADTIQMRIEQIRLEAKPRCPVTHQFLYDCLRSPSKCGTACPCRDDWVGPTGLFHISA